MASLTLKYLRAGGVVYAIQKMRDFNEYPVRIQASPDNTLTTDWSNFSEILWKFAIHYLASEGLTETSELSRSILVYIFHGEYVFSRLKVKNKVKTRKEVNKPIIHALHFNLTANRSRFVQHVEEHFHKLFKVLDEHPEYEKYLDDRGEADVPRLLLIAVETGVRAYAFAKNAKLTMGIGPKKKVTKRVYASINAWRKIETYITAIRFRRGKTSYRRWWDFAWCDFVERQALAETFRARHLPLSDGGDHFGGGLKDPPQWTEEPTIATSKPLTKKVKLEPREGADSSSQTPMRFDAETGSLVPFVDLTSE